MLLVFKIAFYVLGMSHNESKGNEQAGGRWGGMWGQGGEPKVG